MTPPATSPQIDSAQASPEPGVERFVGHARAFAGVTLISRFSGLARDALWSRVFSAGDTLSAFVVAFAIPNLFRRLFGEGALAAAFVPEYATLHQRDPALATRYASAMVALLTLTLGALTIAGEGVLALLRYATPLGDSGALTLELAMCTLPYMPLVCIVALLAGMLQTHGRFAIPAAAPVALNAVLIIATGVGAFLYADSLTAAVFILSLGVPVAGVLQLTMMALALRGRHHWRGAIAGAADPIRRTLRRMGPALVGLGALQFSSLLDQFIAGWPVIVGDSLPLPGRDPVPFPLDEGAASTLFFAQRLYQFPLGVFGIAIATAVFPALARAAGSPDAFLATIRRGVRLSLFIGAPATLGLIAVRRELVAVVYQGGAFTEAQTTLVASTLLGYAVAVWAYTMSHTLTRGFFALGDTRTPMRVSLVAVACNLALNLALIWPLGVAGLAWATAITAIGQCVALTFLSHRRLHEPVFDAPTRTAAVATLILAAVMFAAVIAVRLAPLPAGSWLGHAITLTILVATGAGVYLALARLTNRPELGWLLERGAPQSPDNGRRV
ncbi:MAG: murein biosynthesis integral membrane protein MurJ [Phycisphaeraceae bacterium]|nr:murein biosynthesis integral membrane protein MurJ [Phycisphaeraceae bacterium]